MENKDLETKLLDNKNIKDNCFYLRCLSTTVTVICYFINLFKVTKKLKHTNVDDFKCLTGKWLFFCIVTTYMGYHVTKRYHDKVSKVCIIFLPLFLTILPLLLLLI